MKRFIAVILGLTLFSLSSYSQVPSPTIKQSGKGWESFFPKDWDLIMADSADFNNDLREDYVFIFQADKDYCISKGLNPKFNPLPRILVILMGVGDDSLELGIKSDSVILTNGNGEGEPLVGGQGTGIKTDGNIFEINYAGGLSVQWTGQYKFQYKNKEWTLTYYRGTEYNTTDEDAPIKVFEVDFNKKFLKQDKVKTAMPNLPKLYMDKFKPRTVTIAPGITL